MNRFPYTKNYPFTRRYPTIIIAVISLFIVSSSIALAHPLGNFTVNRYNRLEISESQIRLTYVVDMAEIPAQQERPQIDTDGDGLFSQSELDAYLAKMLPLLQENLLLETDGIRQPWTLNQQELTFPEGQAGLLTMRLRLQFSSAVDTEKGAPLITFWDNTFAQRLGWQEVIVQPTDSIELLTSTVPSTDLSNELTAYPSDWLQNPPTVNRAEFQYRIVGSGSTASSEGTTKSGSVPDSSIPAEQFASADTGSPNALGLGGSDPFAELIRLTDLGPWTLFVALLAAFGWGAAHALSPGHGKTIVGAYLVGSRGTVKHALFLGLTTTITHTVGVFALGLVTLFASRYILPETLFPWLSLASGLLVVAIGLSMVWNWLAQFRKQQVGRHEHHHGHHHDESHEHGHSHHTHDHGHAHDHTHTHGGLHTHDGIHYHSHEVPGQDGQPITWRSLLALGVSGGLLPCPSALVVMLGAIALQRIGFGLLLIIAFSLGLAGVLTAFGLTLVYAGKFFARMPESARFLKAMPVASSLFITMVGAGITWQALVMVL